MSFTLRLKTKIKFIIRNLKNSISLIPFILFNTIKYYLIKIKLLKKIVKKINLCGGNIHIDGYYNIDMSKEADLYLNLKKKLLPFANNSADVIICISAINYFTRKRGQEIIKDVYRVLKPGGLARFGTQDFESITKKYINDDRDFFFQKLPDGSERFSGITKCDKINSWFYGYTTPGGSSQYFYDYETLALLFKEAGFKAVEKKGFLDSRLTDIDKIDNRPDQMFFLEAIK